MPERDALNVAHRGASIDAPENTRAAVELAIAQGADAVEFDLRRTADGQLVIFHDADVRRTTDGAAVFTGRDSYDVATLTLGDLRRLDCGQWKDETFAGQRVLTLAEMLDLLHGSAGAIIEIKRPEAHPGIEEDLVNALAAHPFLGWGLAHDRLVVASVSVDGARTFAELRPDIPAGVLTFRPQLHDRHDLERVAAFATHIGTGERRLPPGFVETAHGLGIERLYTRTERPEDMRHMLATGLGDGVFTDEPAVMHALKHAQHPGGERRRGTQTN